MKIVVPWQSRLEDGFTFREPKYVSAAQTLFRHSHDVRVIDGAPLGAQDCVIWLRSDCTICAVNIAGEVLSHFDTALIEP